MRMDTSSVVQRVKDEDGVSRLTDFFIIIELALGECG